MNRLQTSEQTHLNELQKRNPELYRQMQAHGVCFMGKDFVEGFMAAIERGNKIVERIKQ